MRRSTSSLALAGLISLPVVALGAACGDDGGSGGPDASLDAPALENEGFPVPTAVTKANDNDVEVGDADWTCLNTPTSDLPGRQGGYMLSGKIRDFQTAANGVGGATITAFPGAMLGGNLGTATASNDAATKGDFSINLGALPQGETRYGFKIERPASPPYLRTYLLNQYFNPANAAQTRDISAVSVGTATAVIAFVGESFDATKGTLAGAFRDCQGREVSNAVATVSSVSGRVQHLPGANTFYFGSSGLPVRHNVEPVLSSNGLFVVIDLPPQTANAFIQIWGFRTQAELDAGTLTLLSELASPVEANAIITGSIEPKRM